MTLISDGLREGRKLKEEGKEKVAWNNQDFLTLMRSRAKEIAREKGGCSTNELHEYADKVGVKPTHTSTWGTIFLKADWVPYEWVESNRPEAHGRWIRVWRPR